MALTWIAIAASLLMGVGALVIFIWAVRSQQFKDFEDVKYQVFWSDLQNLVEPQTPKESKNGHDTKNA